MCKEGVTVKSIKLVGVPRRIINQVQALPWLQLLHSEDKQVLIAVMEVLARMCELVLGDASLCRCLPSADPAIMQRLFDAGAPVQYLLLSLHYLSLHAAPEIKQWLEDAMVQQGSISVALQRLSTLQSTDKLQAYKAIRQLDISIKLKATLMTPLLSIRYTCIHQVLHFIKTNIQHISYPEFKKLDGLENLIDLVDKHVDCRAASMQILRHFMEKDMYTVVNHILEIKNSSTAALFEHLPKDSYSHMVVELALQRLKKECDTSPTVHFENHMLIMRIVHCLAKYGEQVHTLLFEAVNKYQTSQRFQLGVLLVLKELIIYQEAHLCSSALEAVVERLLRWTAWDDSSIVEGQCKSIAGEVLECLCKKRRSEVFELMAKMLVLNQGSTA